MASPTASPSVAVTPNPTPQATAVPSETLVTQFRAKLEAGQVDSTSGAELRAAIAEAFVDPTIAEWMPCDGSLCLEAPLSEVVANTLGSCESTDRQISETTCTYLGVDLYKTYQALQTPASLNTFTVFLAYVSTRADLAKLDPVYGRTSDKILDGLASCRIGFDYDFCKNVWKLHRVPGMTCWPAASSPTSG